MRGSITIEGLIFFPLIALILSIVLLSSVGLYQAGELQLAASIMSLAGEEAGEVEELYLDHGYYKTQDRWQLSPYLTSELYQPENISPYRARYMVYATATGQKYHTRACRHVALSRRMMPWVEAEKKYQACKVCEVSP